MEKKLNEDYFIWVRAGSEKTVADIMLDISGQVLEVLKRNNIYIENGDLIENYFVAFSGLMEEKGFGFFNRVVNWGGLDNQKDGRDYLNGKLMELSKLHRTIYLIIDDLDRCDREYQLKMFKVIRESTELINCKAIFLVDQKRFLDKEYDANYIEKYISYTLDLCKVDCQEIIKYHINDILCNDFFEKLAPILLMERSADEIRTLVGNYPNSVLEVLKNEIVIIEEENKRKAETDKENGKVEDLTQTIKEIEKNICNPRKVKNHLKGIERDISNLSMGIDECIGEFKNEDWVMAIIEVQFVKNILPEVFTEVKMSTNIWRFWINYKGYSLNLIWGIYIERWLYSEKKVEVLNNIIYNIDIIDFLHIKTQREKYLAELKSGKENIRHINQYVEYVQTYEDLNKVIDICRNQSFDSDADKETFLVKILKYLSERSSPFKTNEEKFLNFSKRLISWAVKSNLSKKGERICAEAGHAIVERCIEDNSTQTLKKYFQTLSLFLKYVNFGMKWKMLYIKKEIVRL